MNSSISIIWQSILSKYVGDFLFLLKEGEEEEPVVHNEAAVFRWEQKTSKICSSGHGES